MPSFEIQDIAYQNKDGISFRALDKSTGQIVSLRRFFPFGQDENGGVGLDLEESKDFTSACKRLSEINHPALRKTIFGDTDPIDGMPYIVTEWVDGGSPLVDVIRNHTMDPIMIIGLVRQALDVCMAISTVFESEAVWIDTKLEAIQAFSHE
jgi:serine/threonine protein kinase